MPRPGSTPHAHRDRPTVLFGRHYVWRFVGGRWSLTADPVADARRAQLEVLRSELAAALAGAR